MKCIVYFFLLWIVLPCNGQSNCQQQNEKNNTPIGSITTYPKTNQRGIPKTWKSLVAIQKDWIKVERDQKGYLIYQPCDGKTETIQLNGGRLTINWRIEDAQQFELEKFTRLIGNDAFRADAYDSKNKVGFEINVAIIDYKNGIVLWEFNGNKWLMTPKQNYKSFRIIKNNCKNEKKKELDFLPNTK